MKRFFNRSTPQAPTPYYNQEPEPYEHGHPSPTREYPLGATRSRHEEQVLHDQGTFERSKQLRRGGGLTSPRLQAAPSGTSGSTSSSNNRRPRSGGAGAAAAYPSYGEVQLDSNENKGGGAFISPPSAEPGEAVSHQRLPPRSAVPRSPTENHYHHARSRSNTSNQGQAHLQGAQRRPSYSSRADSQQLAGPLYNPFAASDTAHKVERRASTTQRKGGSGLNRSKSSSVRPFSGGISMVDDEQRERPSRRPSLLYGIDSGVHGGYASAALANASERESRDDVYDDSRGRDDGIFRPETRYVDRSADTRAAQSAAAGTGMDKMKRKLFGRRKKDGQLQVEERETDSGEDGLRFEALREVDTPDRTPRRSSSRERHKGEGKAEHGHAGVPWFSNKKMGHGNKQTEGAITAQIGSLCIEEEEEWDWDEINSLIYLISRSEVASKEAAQALRKEFKYGEEEPRFRAVRLWVVICIRASDRFRLQVAQKKFLDVLGDVYSDKKTSTRLRGRLLLSLSMLAHEYQLDDDLQSITRMFNKIKPSDMPLNGTPLNHSHELLNPPALPMGHSITNSKQPDLYMSETNTNTGWDGEAHRAAGGQMMGSVHAQEFPPPTMTTTTTVVRTSSLSQPVTDSEEAAPAERLPRLSDDMRRLHQECHVARSNAQVMTEALIEHGLQDELVSEFMVKTQLSQDFILAQIPWASAQADRSRAENATPDGMVTQEEELLKDLLETHEKVATANGLVEEARRREREEDEERQVLDRSLREQRIDRSALVQDPQTGHLYSLCADGHQDSREHIFGGGRGLTVPRERGEASSSRSASPVPPTARRPLPVPGAADLLKTPANAATAMQKSLSAASQVPLPPSVGGTGPPSLDGSWLAGSNGSDEQQLHGSKSLSALQRGGGPRPMTMEPSPLAALTTTPSQTNGSRGTNRHFDDSDGDRDEDDDSVIMTPIAPSAKALGKRRAMSIYDSPPASSTTAAANTNTITTMGGGGGGSQGVATAIPSNAIQLVDKQMGSMRLNSSQPTQQKEEVLRARPPPALPPTPLQQLR